MKDFESSAGTIRRSTSVLILGANGMLGHRLVQTLVGHFHVAATIRREKSLLINYPTWTQTCLIGGVAAEDFDSIVRVVAACRPQVVINCIGIVKQLPAAKDSLQSILVNALFPHRLARLCQAIGARLIHFSTDCVFSGRRGGYVEDDVADADDLYGRTKFLGEVSYDGCLTLRTSMIGRELATSHGLIEWFLSQEGKTIRGYTRAIFSGLSTSALSDVIAHIVAHHPGLQGVYHVGAEPISKFELLSLVKQVYGLNVQIVPDEEVICDRSLNADRFRRVTGFVPPTWPNMIEHIYQDATPYAELRGSRVNQ